MIVDTGFSERAAERLAVEADRAKAAAWIRKYARTKAALNGLVPILLEYLARGLEEGTHAK